MADNDAPKGGQQDEDKGAEFKPITSQADLDRLISDRLSRERAKYSDYDAIKAKAEKFDKAEQESLTEIQREKQAREAAEAELVKYRTKEQVATWAAEITKGSDVPASVLRGSTREELAEHFEVLKGLVAKNAPKRTAIPAGKGDKDGTAEGGRAAAALRQLRQSG